MTVWRRGLPGFGEAALASVGKTRRDVGIMIARGDPPRSGGRVYIAPCGMVQAGGRRDYARKMNKWIEKLADYG